MCRNTYAEVIVDNSNTNIDRTFTYKIPTKHLDYLDIGMRVVVPFGFGNKKVEGIIINLKNDVDFDKSKIKSIYKVLDESPLLSSSLIELGKWMRNEYLSTYNDVYRTILPSGITNKIKKYIKLDEKTNVSIKELKSDNQKKIVNYLLENGESEISSLKDILNLRSINNSVNSLKEKGIIRLYEKIDAGIGKKYEKYIKLCIDVDIEKILESYDKKALKQKQILDIIKDKKTIKLSEVLQRVNTTLSTARALEKKGLLEIIEVEVKRNPIAKDIDKNYKLKFTTEQQKCFNEIWYDIDNKINNKFLIHGVTGSGKTEIYLQLIDNMIKCGKDSIVLVPEISLTPQTIDRFVGRFGDRVAILHSRLSIGERYDEWRKIKEGEVDIVIGARSAIFAPFNNLGLIIIDEEHENSYKSNMSPKYDTIEVAKKRCDLEDASLILGSATPSIDTYYKAKNNEIKLLSMNYRVNNKNMPKVKIIDMKKELNDGNKSMLSRELYFAIDENLKNKRQTMIFLNRRGFSSFVSCRSCGHVIKCKNCDISLTYHKTKNLLQCHYCGLSNKIPTICPECESKYIKHFGIGTQKVEDYLKNEFPSAVIERMDVDTTSKKGSHERILDRVKNRKVDILIGTQMITKGLDFPNVTLVGILAADMSLNLPDYNASERTFQLITQVSGRAGRGNIEGNVILQTYDPLHYSLQYSKDHDYINFYNNEIILRKEFRYPPFFNIINIIISGEDELLYKEVEKVYYKLTKELKLIEFSLEDLLGPHPAPISKIKGKYRWQILIKCSNDYLNNIKNIVYNICIRDIDNSKSMLKFSVDINPNSIM